MIKEDGIIQNAYNQFKKLHPNLKYFFVTLRFKDRMKGSANWHNLKSGLCIDGKFCFFGRTEHADQEWLPWREELIKKHEAYYGEFEKLIEVISNLT